MISLLLGAASSAIAVVAVAVAAWHVRTTAKAAGRSNALPVASAAFNEFRSREFQSHLHKVWHEAPAGVPEGGFESLAEDWRASAYRVAYFFEYLGILVAHGLVPADLVVDFSANLLVRSWLALEPFIAEERRHRRAMCAPAGISPGFVRHFEHLVSLAFDADGRPVDSRIHERLGLRKMPQVRSAHPITHNASR